MESLLGVRVKITTILDTTVTGRIYSFCPTTNTIAIGEDVKEGTGAGGNVSNNKNEIGASDVDYSIVKSSFIKEISVLERPVKKELSDSTAGARSKDRPFAAFQKAEPSIAPVTINYLGPQEKVGIKDLLHERAISGVGVSSEAQKLFNALYKLVPCQWQGKSIIALDEVRIDPPYSPETCFPVAGKSSDIKSLEYVRRIVGGIQDNIKGG